MTKIIIYQALARLWGKFSFWDEPAFNYLKSLSVDCLYLTGVPRHSTGESFVKGDPGSPYAIEDWFDVNPYLATRKSARMSEFEALLDRAHKAGLKVIIDYVPNHVGRNYKGAIPCFDYCDYDWTDTRKVNWGDPTALEEMIKVLEFWAAKGVDGFRCDMVELVPADAIALLIARVRNRYPKLMFVAEVYERGNYDRYVREVGFDLLYDKSGVYDILRGIFEGKRSARELTWNWQFLGENQNAMLNFMENHDEQRLCSVQFASDYCRTFAMMGFAALYNTASLMIYGGQELGEKASESSDGRTSIFNWTKVDSIDKLKRYIRSGKGLSKKDFHCLSRYRELLSAASDKLFAEGDVWDLCYCNQDVIDPERQFAFARFDSKSAAVALCNFSDRAFNAKLRMPEQLVKRFGEWVELEADGNEYIIKNI